MWVLLNNFQLFIFIGMWQVSWPDFSNTVLKELKRIALGEFFDDIDFGRDASESLGMDPGEKDEEPTGKDRLGSDSIIDNLGISLVLITVGIFFLFISVCFCDLIANKYKISDKNRGRVTKCKQRVMFNPLLRFSLLNTLKWNLLSLASFTIRVGTIPDTVFGVFIFIAMLCLPFFYARILYKAKDRLRKEKNRKKIGTLYDGLRTHILPKIGKERIRNPVWWFPVAFMLRRTAFIMVTVLLFDYPALQFIVHQIISLFYIRYLSTSNLFESKLRRWIEIVSEFICLLCALFMQQFLLKLNKEAEESVENAFILALSLCTFFNVIFVATMCKRTRRDAKLALAKKKYQEVMEKRREAHQAKEKIKKELADKAMADAEQNSRVMFAQ